MQGTARADTLDLRAATLEYAPGGGGYVSFAQGIHGGFTIANGAVIENAAGGLGDDRIQGNQADNNLQGGGGQDTLSGGDGSDDFVFTAVSDSAGAGRDTILDFRAGKDDIVVGAIDANDGVAGDQGFRLDAGGAFVAGEVRQTVSNRSLLLEFNTDGDAEAEMAILLAGVTRPLGAGDFDL